MARGKRGDLERGDIDRGDLDRGDIEGEQGAAEAVATEPPRGGLLLRGCGTS
jgi:hypothetical protein